MKSVPMDDKQWRAVKSDAASKGQCIREYFYQLIEDAIARKRGKK